MDYQVNLETFRGPLDLLLHLVKRDEVDIRDIPIARLAEQFQDYLNVLALIDVELAGDFLVMASTLMEIKSKLVLPRADAADEDEEDPRGELVRQLLEYKRFKEATAQLEACAEQQSLRIARQQLPVPASPTAPALQPVELWDLVSAFGRLMRETFALQPQAITVDHTPLHVHIETVLQRLSEEPRLPLSRLFTPPHTRSRLVGLFLAILELTKQRRVTPDQPEIFSDIWITLLTEPPPEQASTTSPTEVEGPQEKNLE